MRVNYTTYDVQRAQDVVNASTSHHNILLLDDSDHPFKYGRVLGIYHANIVYTGPGMLDYHPHRFDFLWVRWYRHMNPGTAGWRSLKLDQLEFYPVHDENAFGFVDPSEVLRACHIIPLFSFRKRHEDGHGLSMCARDSSDWTRYVVNR